MQRQEEAVYARINTIVIYRRKFLENENRINYGKQSSG